MSISMIGVVKVFGIPSVALVLWCGIVCGVVWLLGYI